MASIADLIAAVRAALAPYVFRATSEAALQDQVARALQLANLPPEREVPAVGGRYDLLVERYGARVVLELKLRSSVAPVECQAQRYAKAVDVDAVGVVTTSARLAAQLGGMETLGDKPFFVVALRTS